MTENMSPQIELRFLQSRIQPFAQTLLGGVCLQAPKATMTRAPLDLVACIDVSGSMDGAKLDRAKESLIKLVEHLSSSDRLGIVAFESEVHRVIDLTPMDASGKERARQRISSLHTGGITAMSGGLQASLELLAEARRPDALRRVLLFTDGHANSGLSSGDVDGFATLLHHHSKGVNVSWFGYGEDHDGEFLSALAQLSHGNYHQTPNAEAILDAFGRELGGLLSVVATALQVMVRPCPGGGVPTFLNDFPTASEAGSVTLSFPELYAEERRWIVFELPFAAPSDPAPGKRPLVEVEVFWNALPAGEADRISLVGEVELVGESVQLSPPDAELQAQIAILRGAAAQRAAAALVHAGKFADAELVVMQAAKEAKALGTPLGEQLASVLTDAAANYGNEERFISVRSSLANLRQGMGRSRASGTRLDSLFESVDQTWMKENFRAGKKPKPQ